MAPCCQKSKKKNCKDDHTFWVLDNMSFYLSFQSLLDFIIAVFLLITTVAIRNIYVVHSDGVLGWIECRIWNTKSFMWGLFKSSTWNLVALTIER